MHTPMDGEPERTTIMTTTDSTTKPLFPLPVTGTDEADTTTAAGYCAWFCHQDVPHYGTPVDEHGAICTSRALLFADLTDLTGQPAHLYGSLAESYKHGTYPRPVAGRRTYVELALTAPGVTPDEDDDESKRLFVTPGDARSIAAALIRLADEAEMLHPLRHHDEEASA